MKDYTVIAVDPDLLPQVLRELFAVATNPDLVEVNESDYGRVIHAHPEVAEVWYQQVVANGNKNADGGIEVVAAASTEEEPEEVVAESKTAEDETLAESTTLATGLVKRGPGRPRKEVVPTSASNGEEP
jgi:hypothetical protein